MADPILRRAMEKRDEALREVERWEEWIRDYAELSAIKPDPLEITRERGAPTELEIELPSPTLPLSIETSNGKGIWPRGVADRA